ncbi:MAG: ADP-ribosylglycohydrolase family protein [Streptosporangiaceae bacterium]
MITLRDRYRGCLLGGAVGDAPGAGIEFLSLADIRHRHGPRGVNGYVPAYGRLGAITDDTQMTLFTAEGLLRYRQQPTEGRDPAAAIWAAYRRWLATQYGHRAADGSWLASQEFLHHERAPGVTCLSAVESGHPGTQPPGQQQQRLRWRDAAAPTGLADGDPFSLGCQAAALTHGH